MSRKSTLATLTYAPWTLTVIFLTLFIVYCVLYYQLKNKKVDQQPIPAIPAWTKVTKGTQNFTLTAPESFNTYVVKTTSSAGAATFASAASIVANNDRLNTVGQEFYFLINNISGTSLTFVAGTGNTLTTDLSTLTLATASYVIIKGLITNNTAGSEAVTYDNIATGTNA